MKTTLEAIQMQRAGPTATLHNRIDAQTQGYSCKKCLETTNEWEMGDTIRSQGKTQGKKIK